MLNKFMAWQEHLSFSHATSFVLAFALLVLITLVISEGPRR